MERLHGPVVSWGLVVIKLYRTVMRESFSRLLPSSHWKNLDKTSKRLMSDNLSH